MSTASLRTAMTDDEIVEVMARLWWENTTESPRVPWPNLHDIMRDYALEQGRKMLAALRKEGCEIVRWRPIGEMTQPQYDRYRENGHFDSLPAIAVGGDHFCILTGPEKHNG